MKHIKFMLLLAAMLLPLSCTADEEAKPDGKHALVDTEWTYHFEGIDTLYGRVMTHIGDYTLRFDTDSTGTYSVDAYVIINGTSQSSQSQMAFRYTFDGRNGTISYIFPDNTPSYVRQSMPDQPFVYDPKDQTLTCISWDPDFLARYGDMVYHPKK